MTKASSTRTGDSARMSAGKSLVVVLGMHRSGTSAVTRGLQVLGVELGDRLMVPIPDNNEKGFFEDVDANAINVGLYQSLGGGQDWHTLALVPGDELLNERHAALHLRAVEWLKAKMWDVNRFGLKDPRMCRLLPFWQAVFRQLQIEVSYVICLRNPLSVAQSLDKRDGLPAEKSHYLWLEHVIPSVLLTQGAPRAVVDYDQLMSDPARELKRVARALGFDKQLDPVRLAEFSGNFLEERLRHATFTLADVMDDPLVPDPVRVAFKTLADVATDELALDSKEVAGIFRSLSGQLDGMRQAMSYLQRLENGLVERDRQIETLMQTAGQRDAHVANLEQVMNNKDAHIANLEHMLAERNAHASNLEHMLAERNAHASNLEQVINNKNVHIANLEQAAQSRDAQLADLDRALAERSARIAALNQALHERDTHFADQASAAAEQRSRIAALELTREVQEARIKSAVEEARERDARIDVLNQELKDKEAVIQRVGVNAVQLNHRLRQARTSVAWRLFTPLRMLMRLLAHRGRRLKAELVVFNQLRQEGTKWESIGNDPQFLLTAEYDWSALPGWSWLDLEVVSERPLNAQLYFDRGDGFDAAGAINFQLRGNGRQRIPLFVPPRCHAIRLDPCDGPATFRLITRGLTWLKAPPALPAEFLGESGKYDALASLHESGKALR